VDRCKCTFVLYMISYTTSLRVRGSDFTQGVNSKRSYGRACRVLSGKMELFRRCLLQRLSHISPLPPAPRASFATPSARQGPTACALS